MRRRKRRRLSAPSIRSSCTSGLAICRCCAGRTRAVDELNFDGLLLGVPAPVSRTAERVKLVPRAMVIDIFGRRSYR